VAGITDYYKVLEIPRDASSEAIRKAYLKQIRQWHPDVNKSPEATVRTQQIVGAADIPSHAAKRCAYDEELKRGVSPASSTIEQWEYYQRNASNSPLWWTWQWEQQRQADLRAMRHPVLTEALELLLAGVALVVTMAVLYWLCTALEKWFNAREKWFNP
jgi:curved DNA-binding protein CbpA